MRVPPNPTKYYADSIKSTLRLKILKIVGAEMYKMAEGTIAPIFINLSSILGFGSKTIYTVCNRKIDWFGKQWLEKTYMYRQAL